MNREPINVVVERARAAIASLPDGAERTALGCMMDVVERAAAMSQVAVVTTLGPAAARLIVNPPAEGRGSDGDATRTDG